MDNQTPSSASEPTPIPVTPVGVTATPMPATAAMGGMPSSSMLPSRGPFGGGGGASPLMYALIGILGLGTVGFGILAVVSFNKASVATTTLNQQKAAAVAVAKKEQQKADTEANTLANESPFRSYVAPVEFGSFEIKFPKNWASWVDQEPSSTQVNLVVNPDFVRKTNGAEELYATRVRLIERSKDLYFQAYAALIKRGTLKSTETTVSGLKAYDVTGTFGDKRTTREVVVPVRDKVLVFTNENSRYATEFGQILAQAKIIP